MTITENKKDLLNIYQANVQLAYICCAEFDKKSTDDKPSVRIKL